MNQPLRLGIIGCSGISHAHGDAALALSQKVRFVACCDLREEAAGRWAARYGAERTYTDYQAMLRRETLDGTVLLMTR